MLYWKTMVVSYTIDLAFNNVIYITQKHRVIGLA
jgi:hypothetical protein